MTSRWRVCLVLAALAAGCSSVPARNGLTPSVRDQAKPLRVQVAQERNAVRTVRLEDYVRAAAISEFAPPSGDPELIERMLEVQSVIARTYALANRGRHRRQGFDLCSTTHCQLYEPSRLRTSRWAEAAAIAVRQTAGAVVWHEGGPAVALFHADCGGHTSTSVSAWGGTERSYLKAVRDDGHNDSAHAQWTYAATTAAILDAINADPRSRVGARLDAISVLKRDASGRAATVRLKGARELLIRGEDLRAILARDFGPRAVRSTLFDVKREGRSFVFTGRGFGHGVGLCQAGALARLRGGARPAEVLERYYPGTTLRAAN
ncbi:MAG: SpoIID/LytB domain-containing protein [Acidobacteriota bacterium]|nr:SpoIID/LytB domain-containing protein [Acidobacteriota bacterium]